MLLSMIYHALIERDRATGVYVGSVPGIPGAHSQGDTVDEVRRNLAEVLELLQEEGALEPESDYIATTTVAMA